MQANGFSIQEICKLAQNSSEGEGISRQSIKALIERVYAGFMANNDVAQATTLLLDIQALQASDLITDAIYESLIDVSLQLGLVSCAQRLLEETKKAKNGGTKFQLAEEDEF